MISESTIHCGALTNYLRYYCADLNGQKVVVCILCVLKSAIEFIVLHLNKRTSSVIAGLLFGSLFLLCSGIDNKFFAGKVFNIFVVGNGVFGNSYGFLFDRVCM